MLKKTMTYVDFNDEERTEDFYFNLTKSEWLDWEMSIPGGLQAHLGRVVSLRDTPELGKLYKDLILRSYGEKSADGRRFEKSPELSKAFSETQAYDDLYMELLTQDSAAVNFIAGIVSKDVAAEFQKQMAARQAAEKPAIAAVPDTTK